MIVVYCFSCNKKTDMEGFKKPADSDIKKIVESIIENDSLQKKEDEKIFINLIKAKVIFTELGKPYMPSLDVVYDFEIKNLKMNLDQQDLKYLQFQYANGIHSQLSEKFNKGIVVTENKEMEGQLVYRFSYPIFTLHNEAYVKMVSYISGHFLDCRGYVLHKENDKWKLIEKKILFSH